MRGTETKPEQERRLMIRFYEGGGCNKVLIVGYREVALVPTILIGLSLVLTGSLIHLKRRSVLKR